MIGSNNKAEVCPAWGGTQARPARGDVQDAGTCGKTARTTAEEGLKHKAKEVCNAKANEVVKHSDGSSYEARRQELLDKEVPHAKVAPKLRLCALPG